jgi:hypothetical protein
MPISRKRSLGAFFCGLIVLIAGLSGGGCRSAHPRYAYSPLPADLFPPGEHRLSPGEEITFRSPEGTNYAARIKEDGTVNLPLIGDGMPLARLATS